MLNHLVRMMVGKGVSVLLLCYIMVLSNRLLSVSLWRPCEGFSYLCINVRHKWLQMKEYRPMHISLELSFMILSGNYQPRLCQMYWPVSLCNIIVNSQMQNVYFKDKPMFINTGHHPTVNKHTPQLSLFVLCLYVLTFKWSKN